MECWLWPGCEAKPRGRSCWRQPPLSAPCMKKAVVHVPQSLDGSARAPTDSFLYQVLLYLVTELSSRSVCWRAIGNLSIDQVIQNSTSFEVFSFLCRFAFFALKYTTTFALLFSLSPHLYLSIHICTHTHFLLFFIYLRLSAQWHCIGSKYFSTSVLNSRTLSSKATL